MVWRPVGIVENSPSKPRRLNFARLRNYSPRQNFAKPVGPSEMRPNGRKKSARPMLLWSGGGKILGCSYKTLGSYHATEHAHWTTSRVNCRQAGPFCLWSSRDWKNSSGGWLPAGRNNQSGERKPQALCQGRRPLAGNSRNLPG